MTTLTCPASEAHVSGRTQTFRATGKLTCGRTTAVPAAIVAVLETLAYVCIAGAFVYTDRDVVTAGKHQLGNMVFSGPNSSGSRSNARRVGNDVGRGTCCLIPGGPLLLAAFHIVQLVDLLSNLSRSVGHSLSRQSVLELDSGSIDDRRCVGRSRT